ncbi:hypothetical protein [Chromobacterium violaceum]|nr:hypothetical protein [Chromobacterium violaceum]
MQAKFKKIGNRWYAFPKSDAHPEELKRMILETGIINSIEDLESPDKLVLNAQTDAGVVTIVMDDDGLEIRIQSENTLPSGEKILEKLEKKPN